MIVDRSYITGRVLGTEAEERRRAFKKRKSSKITKMRFFAKNLNKNLPKSEVWFREIFHPFYSHTDWFNTAYEGYIPDVLNLKYKYIIEVDGSIHNTKKQKTKDVLKDIKFTQLGFMVLRIKAYDIDSFNNAMSIVLKIKGPNFKPDTLPNHK